MVPRTPTRTTVPSRAVLRVLRRLALTGSTVGVIGGACAVGAINYEIQRKVQVAEQLVESKRSLHSKCPKYNPDARDSALAKMQKAAEAGEFQGLESMKEKNGETAQSTISADDSGGENNRVSVEDRDRAMPAPGPPGSVTQSELSVRSVSDAWSNWTREDQRSSPFYRPAELAMPFSNFNYRTQDHTNYEHAVATARKLLDGGKPLEAAHHFLDHTLPLEYSEEHTNVAIYLLYANLKEKHEGVAVRVFRRIAIYGAVTPALWRAILNRLAEAKRWESLSEIYCRFSSDFDIDDRNLRNTIMNGLIYTQRFQVAKKMVLQYLDRDAQCRLCATYLEGLRKYSRSVELVESEFKRLLKTLSSQGLVVTESLFHPLLRTYINFGYDEKAQHLLQEMRTTYGFSQNAKVLGMFATSKAVKADWEGVDGLLKEMAACGNGPENVQSFRRHFDRIFLEYFLSHSGQEIRDFVFRAVEHYGLLPDQLLFEHILMAYVQKGTRDMIIELVEAAEDKLWQVNCNKEYFLDCLRSQRMNCEKGSVGLWQMFRAAQQKYGAVPASNSVLGFDKSSFPNLDVLKAPYTGGDTRTSLQAESVTELTRPIDNYGPLVRRMVLNMHVGKYDRVLKFYRAAKKSKKVMKRTEVKLAVVASIFHYASWKDTASMASSLRNARSIIQAERDIFLDFDESVTPTLFRIILESDPTQKYNPGDLQFFRYLKKALLLFYKTLEDHNFPIKHDMLTSLSLRTLLAGKPRKALTFIRKVNQSKYGGQASLDAYGLTVVARCCALCGNFRGVRWAILSGFKRRPSGIGDFIDEVDMIIEQLRVSQNFLDVEERKTFDQEVDSLQALARSVRREHGIGTDRSSGSKYIRRASKDKEVTTVQTVSKTRGDRQPVEQSPSRLPTEETLASWDERLELEKALAPRDGQWNLVPPNDGSRQHTSDDTAGAGAAQVAAASA